LAFGVVVLFAEILLDLVFGLAKDGVVTEEIDGS
jgi:hypothetical protein